MRTWEPDTCGCCVEELYDGGAPVGIGQVVRKCDAHAGVADGELYAVLLDVENRRKNSIQYHVVSGGLGVEGASIGWSFAGAGAERQLSVWIIGVASTAELRAALQSFCDGEFGAGKVTVV